MDRKEFFRQSAKCAVAGFACCSGLLPAQTPKPEPSPTPSEAAFLRTWLNKFIAQEEQTMDRAALVRLLQERGRACCRALEFRQEMIREADGNLDKLVELLAKRVGPDNCRREGKLVTLIYPTTKCGCGWSPKRDPIPNDPYCECSMSNNRTLFETVTGKPVRVELTESPRRGGSRCRFLIHLT